MAGITISEKEKRLTRPLSNEELLLKENIPDKEEPKDLKELQRRSPIYFTPLKADVKPRIEFLDSEKVWQLNLENELMPGRPGGETILLPKPDLKSVERIELKPNIPEWSGVTYHPKVSTSFERKVLTRISGKKVTAHGHIFGADDRTVYYPSGYPWRCIGKVEAWYIDGTTWHYLGSGTGALVGDNVMVTSSHMFPWSYTSAGYGWAMKFTPSYYDGSSILGGGVYSWCASAYGYSDHDQGDDLVVMKLYTAIGTSLGWFGTKTYNDDWEDGNYWTKCGYPGMIASGQRPSRIMWFPIVDDDSDGAGTELEYKADASGGDSGGPVFGWWDNGPHLVGVHSGGETEYHFPFSLVDNNVAAGGSILPNLVIWAQNNW